MRPNDATLAARPKEFRYTRSAVLTWVFVLFGVLAVAGLLLAIVNFDAIREDASDMTGRRSGLRGLVAPGCVSVTAFFAFLFGWLALAGAHRWSRVATGTTLKQRYFTVDGGSPVGDALHARFATGDPSQYLPVPNQKKGAITVGVYLAAADRLGFVTVQLGRGAAAQHWPLVTFRDTAFVQLKRLDLSDFSRPAAPPASIDAFPRG